VEAAAVKTFDQADADALNAHYASMPTQDMLAAVLASDIGRDFVVVSSFGAESAVLLDLVAHVRPETPVVFIDTGRLFPETLAYRDQLVELLGLEQVRTARPRKSEVTLQDPHLTLWSTDSDACCKLRKVDALDRALDGVSAWITGRKAHQSLTRASLPLFEIDNGRLKFNPLAQWSADMVDSYAEERDLPRHPLVPFGYLSIGCMPCTSPVAPGEDPRAGRWRGMEKTECGIHQPTAEDLTPDAAAFRI
jgi:phosphoadenosine phosphosulfate reductase